jgi:hypothetical protein
MSARLVVDNTRSPAPRRRSRTDCFEDADGIPIEGTPAPVPCPFCGGGPDDLQLVGNGSEGFFDGDCTHPNAPDCLCTYYVDCMGCGAEGPHGVTRLEAAEGWNRRAAEAQAAADGDLAAGR